MWQDVLSAIEKCDWAFSLVLTICFVTGVGAIVGLIYLAILASGGWALAIMAFLICWAVIYFAAKDNVI